MQNSAAEGPGRIAQLLGADGYEIDIVRAWEGGGGGLGGAGGSVRRRNAGARPSGE